MHLSELRLRNFRSFYGDQTVSFAPPGPRSVTVIHGENGAGKTNLLNALFWCLTGEFTPRLSRPDLLVNTQAHDENRACECAVELLFRHGEQDFRAVRAVLGRNQSRFSLYVVEDGISRSILKPETFIERIVPKALSRWFFFDAEAIGELELSGSESFRTSLRRILGFELVDTLVEDLDRCLTSRQGDLARLVNSKDLTEIQARIQNIEHVLPAQRAKASEWEEKALHFDGQVASYENQLLALPKAKPLQDRRSRLESQRIARNSIRKELRSELVALIGTLAPALLLFSKAAPFDDQLHVRENSGRLPAPYSEQLVEDILQDHMCVCGRPVLDNSAEELAIRNLLRNASTTLFNARIRAIQYLLKDIRDGRDSYMPNVRAIESKIVALDNELSEIDDELQSIRAALQSIDEQSIRDLESKRAAAQSMAREAHRENAVVNSRIEENERVIKDLRTRYESASQRLGHGTKVRTEISKLQRLRAYIAETLLAQEGRALTVLQMELNQVLAKYLTKHFAAQINPRTYEVSLLDAKDRHVGRSTGEGQVLKFAFITTVVALAGRKTQEKINFLAEPTVAPLVLDAPFSALDSEYQGSVADNLATQSTQLVLLLSSAAWGERVAQTLNTRVGRRYVLISREAGPRGQKPIKTMSINGKRLALNEYGALRTESVIMELA